MQRPDEKKRKSILAAAEALFTARPFHEVKLDEVAAKARVGKGTIYIYFKNKDDLYASLIREGLLEFTARLREKLAMRERSSLEELRLIVSELVGFAAARPKMYELLRSILPGLKGHGFAEARNQRVQIIREVIERGCQRGELRDPNPELTAQFILSAVRTAMLFGPAKLRPEELTEHILFIVGQGIARPAKERRS